MKTYVTFEQIHTHYIGQNVFNKDCVAVIECDNEQDGRNKTFEIFGKQFAFEHYEKYWDEGNMKYFPRGYIYIDEEDI